MGVLRRVQWRLLVLGLLVGSAIAWALTFRDPSMDCPTVVQQVNEYEETARLGGAEAADRSRQLLASLPSLLRDRPLWLIPRPWPWRS